jgi:hypothetical protein
MTKTFIRVCGNNIITIGYIILTCGNNIITEENDVIKSLISRMDWVSSRTHLFLQHDLPPTKKSSTIKS